MRAYYELMDPFLALQRRRHGDARSSGSAPASPWSIQRDPIVTAKLVSTIDQLSNGRFLFGVGNGWNQDEIENHGTAFKTRHKLARERIEAMKAIWTGEEPEYHGEFVNFDKMKQWPKPGRSRIRRSSSAAVFPMPRDAPIRYGDGWIPRDDEGRQDHARSRPLGRVAAPTGRLRRQLFSPSRSPR